MTDEIREPDGIREPDEIRELDETVEAVRDALRTHGESCEIERELPSRDPNRVYEVRLDGRRAVCKLGDGPDAYVGRHAFVARHVSKQTQTPTPRVLGVGEEYALFAWADGTAYEADAPRKLRKRRLWNAGATLANLHEETGFDGHGYLHARNGELELDAEGGWPAMLESIVAGWTDDLRGTRFESDGDALLGLVRDHADVFDAAAGPDLVHGDYQPGNVRFDGEEVVGVLDWEFSLAGAGEFDLVRAEQEFFDWHDAPEGDSSDRSDDDLREALLEGYESVRTLPAGFEGRREAYRATLKLDPMRFFDDWKDQVEDPDAMAESMSAFVRESVADAETAFGAGEKA
jgi:Ser/Thr protein kinase RdoA (MazF antagonist)